MLIQDVSEGQQTESALTTDATTADTLSASTAADTAQADNLIADNSVVTADAVKTTTSISTASKKAGHAGVIVFLNYNNIKSIYNTKCILFYINFAFLFFLTT